MRLFYRLISVPDDVRVREFRVLAQLLLHEEMVFAWRASESVSMVSDIVVVAADLHARIVGAIVTVMVSKLLLDFGPAETRINLLPWLMLWEFLRKWAVIGKFVVAVGSTVVL